MEALRIENLEVPRYGHRSGDGIPCAGDTGATANFDQKIWL